MYFFSKQLPELKKKNFKQRYWFMTYVAIKSHAFKAAVLIPMVIIFFIGVRFNKQLIFTSFEGKHINTIIPIWTLILMYAPILNLIMLNMIAPSYRYIDFENDKQMKGLQ